MAIVPSVEAASRFGELLDRVVAGEEILITRQDRPIARIVREGASEHGDVTRAAENLEALQKEIANFYAGKPPVSWPEFKSMVEEGRR